MRGQGSVKEVTNARGEGECESEYEREGGEEEQDETTACGRRPSTGGKAQVVWQQRQWCCSAEGPASAR
jgi:hypothetical protein